MVDVLLKAAAKQGYTPDCSVAGDEVDFPRPYPMMVFRNMEKLGIMDVKRVVKVDDTKGGIGEGRNAGCWTVGISHTSTYMNINSHAEYEEMPADEFEERGRRASLILREANPHYIIRDITKLPGVIAKINERLEKGETPYFSLLP